MRMSPSVVLKASAWLVAGFGAALVVLVVGDLSVSTYRGLVGTGRSWPNDLADLLIVALAAWFALGLWAARGAGPVRVSAAVAAGVGAVAAYGASEAVKVLVGQDRPCRALLSVVQCPPVGDWSFPSNHATIAFGLATAIVLMLRQPWVCSAYLLAAVAAAARVVEGVHYPHDVVAGAVVGVCTVMASTTLLATPVHNALSARGGAEARPRRCEPQDGND